MNRERDARIYTVNGITAFWIDALWTVPSSTYDEWRHWYGRVHKLCTWTCFERGQLLVIAPSAGGKQEYSGQPCLYVKGPNEHFAGRSDTNCRVFTRYDGYQEIPTARLVPIELCEPILNPEDRWEARIQLARVPKRTDVWTLAELGVIRHGH